VPVPEDSSLTEFIETKHEQSTTSQDDPERESADADEATVTVTYAWNGEGERCGNCGETVACRWIDDGGLVCADCKAW